MDAPSFRFARGPLVDAGLFATAAHVAHPSRGANSRLARAHLCHRQRQTSGLGGETVYETGFSFIRACTFDAMQSPSLRPSRLPDGKWMPP
jgi:hypothetical protein